MRGWWGEVQSENIRSSPVPLWPIIGPPKKYIRGCPLSLNLSAGEMMRFIGRRGEGTPPYEG
nr:MAG TPA: hypothetical protein [Caudoviricetes sp.]